MAALPCNDANERKSSRCNRDADHSEESHFDSRTGWHWTDPRSLDSGSSQDRS